MTRDDKHGVGYIYAQPCRDGEGVTTIDGLCDSHGILIDIYDDGSISGIELLSRKLIPPLPAAGAGDGT